MAKRGVPVSYESVREWCLKFGGTYTKRIRSRRGRLGDGGISMRFFFASTASCNTCGAVDQDGEVLDILVQPRRNKQAAKKFFRKLLKGLQYVPRGIVTDRLRSYEAAKAEVMPSVAHYRDKGLNNRAGKFPSAYPRTRTPRARVQISRTGAEIPLDLLGNRVVFPSGPTFIDGSELPRIMRRPLHTMA